jgi:hypothetical protein
MRVAYREGANVFEIMDNVSNWYPGKCELPYREDWIARFGIAAEDERAFETYAEIRKRYYESPPPITPEDERAGVGLLGRQKPADRVAIAFYEASTLAAAESSLSAFMRPEDVAALRAFYDHFRPKYEVLVAESAAFRDAVAQLQAQVDAPTTAAYVNGLASYYGVSSLPSFTVLYVWWPPISHTTAHNRGSVLLLQYNPTRHRDALAKDLDIPVHEVVHYLSTHQSEEQKRALAHAFLDSCAPPPGLHPEQLLEEPLAVVHQKLFINLVAPEKLSFSRPWYGGHPWVDPFSKLIYPVVQRSHEAGGKLDEALMSELGRLCARVAPPK